VDANALIESLTAVTKYWTKQRKQEERDAKASQRRTDAMIRSQRVTVREASFQVMAEAYLKASGRGTLPAGARQVMYAARGSIQEATGRQLDQDYFTQVLLPDYMESHPEQTKDWDVVFDARGHFTEPHTNREVPLGTLQVRDYLAGNVESCYLPGSTQKLITLYPTHGAHNRFGAVLFIEKEGFLPLLQKVQLANRYDIAIMSTKGMSNTSARELVDFICRRVSGVPLLIVRDFDKSGFSIAATLQNDTRRYRFHNSLRVHDLGLRLADVEQWELASETVSYGKSDPRDNLSANGATPEEIEFLCRERSWEGYTGQRVELNAFPSDQFVEWLETKLAEYRVTKVIPDKNTLTDAYRRALKATKLQKILAEASAALDEEIQQCVIPEDLQTRVSNKLSEVPNWSWDEAIADMALEVESGPPR
jgi:hypothetical protein